jgi:uncharacterized protein
MKPGGTEGGSATFLGGAGLLVGGLGLYLFLDSVRVTSGNAGWISGWLYGSTGWETTSMGLLFAPFFLGVVTMFYDSQLAVGRWLTGLGILIIILEILSRVRFVFDMKTSHLLLVLAMMAAGTGMVLRSFRDGGGDPNAS